MRAMATHSTEPSLSSNSQLLSQLLSFQTKPTNIPSQAFPTPGVVMLMVGWRPGFSFLTAAKVWETTA